jgi:uncharacterized DUF497 family protein
MKIRWDERKAVLNREKHGLELVDFSRFEWTTAIFRPTYSSMYGGHRLRATGILDGDLVTAVLGGLGTEAISLISLRRASRAERREYEQSREGS